MRFVVTTEQLKAAENKATSVYNNSSQETPSFGVSAVELTERAGKSSFKIINRILNSQVSEKNFVILCGRGGNGADGVVISKYIAEAGGLAICIFVEDLPNTPVAREIYSKYITDGGVPSLLYSSNPPAARNFIKNCDAIIDCVYGAGFHNNLSEKTEDIFRFVNSLPSQLKISIDIPSGVNADSGKISDSAFHAAHTIQISAIKKGVLNYPAFEFCGELHIADIGLKTEYYKTFSAVLTEKDIFRFIPNRRRSSNKSSFGKLLNISGCAHYIGAAMLSTRAALRTGVGMAVLASTKDVIHSCSTHTPEAVFCTLPSDELGFINSPDLKPAEDLLKSATAVLVGCGLGAPDNPSTLKTIETVLKKANGTIILDADGLNSVSKNIDILKEQNNKRVGNCTRIITPHPAEFARLTNTPIQAVQAARIDNALRFALEYNTVVLLKGPLTVIASPDGRVGVNTSGNTALAKAGSGDVLSGIIAAFSAGGVPAYEAALMGAYIHGLAAEKLIEKGYPAATCLATDLIDTIPLVYPKDRNMA